MHTGRLSLPPKWSHSKVVEDELLSHYVGDRREGIPLELGTCSDATQRQSIGKRVDRGTGLVGSEQFIGDCLTQSIVRATHGHSPCTSLLFLRLIVRLQIQ
ncbi:hypothetical protein [Kocuria aegyptia]|uniref:Uncharacterized protein n=1 Tax=Kocuria aegyptia TaxID=330943 RepID=A0ABN2K7N5_9MICC